MAGREYGPTAGIKPLRLAIANLYNAHHRQGKESQYAWENVAVVPGGRAGLIRIAAVLNNAYLGMYVRTGLKQWVSDICRLLHP